jgi:hypothetical protein
MARLGHSTPKAAMLYQQVASARAEEIAAGLSVWPKPRRQAGDARLA